jgi:hypothetical protein
MLDADAGCWILDTGCWMLDVGYWMLDTGYWMLDVAQIRVLKFGKRQIVKPYYLNSYESST